MSLWSFRCAIGRQVLDHPREGGDGFVRDWIRQPSGYISLVEEDWRDVEVVPHLLCGPKVQ